MKILLIRPNLADRRSSDAMQPLVFAILKSLTPPDDEVALYDERLEPIPVDEEADLVGITVETYTARRSFEIARDFRERGVKVVMGGYHATLATDECLPHADAVVKGDAEGIWPLLVEDARRGNLQRIYQQDGFASLAGVTPDRSIFAGKKYAPLQLVQFGRGCRYNCEFCSIRAFYGSNLRQRPIAEVVAELEPFSGKHLFVVDDNIFINVEAAKEFCRAIIPLKVTWSCQISVDVAANPELMKLLQKSGCTTAVVGFESLDPANLKQMRKGWNLKYGDYQTALKAFRDAGIMVYGTFVFGYDHDTVDSFESAVEFASENRFFLANFNPLTPTPGAPLLTRLRDEQRMLYDRWWLDPDYRYGSATFKPRGMTAEEMTQGCYRARTQFNKITCITKRLFDRKTHLRSLRRMGIYLACNLVSRREIHRKQGAAMGDRDLPPVPNPG